MKNNIYPKNYKSVLNLVDTQIAIKFVKDTFQMSLSKKLDLLRVSAPIFVRKNSGLNDGLNGVERPVSFFFDDEEIEIVHSLAKWKRMALAKYDLQSEVEHLHHVLHIVEVQTFDIVFLDILNVMLIVHGKDKVGDAVALGGKDLLLHAAHRQHTTTQGDLARHGQLAFHLTLRESRSQCGEHGDTR